jgi:hypothetical protein
VASAAVYYFVLRLLFLFFLAATGFEPSPQPSGITLSPLSPICKHYPPLFSTLLVVYPLGCGKANQRHSEAIAGQQDLFGNQFGV